MLHSTITIPATSQSPFIDLGEDVFRKLLTYIAGESIDGVLTPHGYRCILPFALCNRHHYILTLSSVKSMAILPLNYKRDPPTEVQLLGAEERKKNRLRPEPKMAPFPVVLLPAPPITQTTLSEKTDLELPFRISSHINHTIFKNNLSYSQASKNTSVNYHDDKRNPGLLTASQMSLSTSSPWGNLKPLVDTAIKPACLSDRLPLFTARLHNLRALHLFRNSEVCDTALEQIARVTAPSLRELRLRAFRTVSEVGIRNVVRLAPNLEILDLSYCHNIRDVVLVDIMRTLRHLRVLHLGYWTLTEVSLDRVLKLRDDEHTSSLDVLDLTACSIQPFCQSSMAKLNAWITRCKVQSLKLRSTHLFNTDTDMRSIHLNRERLTSLDMGLTRRLTDRQLQTLLAVDQGTDEVPRLSLLRSINVSHCTRLTNDTVDMLVKHAPKLTKLDICFCPNISSFVNLSELTHLTSLNLSACTSLTDGDVGMLAKLPWLTSLSLMRCMGLTDNAVDFLVDAAEYWECEREREQEQRQQKRWDFLDFRRCYSVSDEALGRIAKHCRNLIPLPTGELK